MVPRAATNTGSPVNVTLRFTRALSCAAWNLTGTEDCATLWELSHVELEPATDRVALARYRTHRSDCMCVEGMYEAFEGTACNNSKTFW